MSGDPSWTPTPVRDGVVIAYSRNAEDVRLARVFDTSAGFYVDVGAGDPTEFSVTRLFYDRGWSVINIEPGPAYERLAQQRPRDVNLRLAVGNAGGAERMLHAVEILLWNDHDVDVACNQCVDCLCVIGIQELGGSIQSISGFQHFQHQQAQSSSRHADGQALATELRKKRNRLNVSIKNEYC